MHSDRGGSGGGGGGVVSPRPPGLPIAAGRKSINLDHLFTNSSASPVAASVSAHHHSYGYGSSASSSNLSLGGLVDGSVRSGLGSGRPLAMGGWGGASGWIGSSGLLAAGASSSRAAVTRSQSLLHGAAASRSMPGAGGGGGSSGSGSNGSGNQRGGKVRLALSEEDAMPFPVSLSALEVDDTEGEFLAALRRDAYVEASGNVHHRNGR